MEDRDLVRRMLAGHERAFEEFFETYFDRLYRFVVRRVPDEDTAEDIVQTALILAMRKIATWRGEAALFTWLCTLGRHEISAYWARAGRRPLLAVDDDPGVRAELESLAAGTDQPDRALERHELARQVAIVLDYLPHRYGDLLEWKYIEDLSVAEIAARLGATPKAVESALTRARAAFREGFATFAGSH